MTILAGSDPDTAERIAELRAAVNEWQNELNARRRGLQDVTREAREAQDEGRIGDFRRKLSEGEKREQAVAEAEEKLAEAREQLHAALAEQAPDALEELEAATAEMRELAGELAERALEVVEDAEPVQERLEAAHEHIERLEGDLPANHDARGRLRRRRKELAADVSAEANLGLEIIRHTRNHRQEQDHD